MGKPNVTKRLSFQRRPRVLIVHNWNPERWHVSVLNVLTDRYTSVRMFVRKDEAFAYAARLRKNNT